MMMMMYISTLCRRKWLGLMLASHYPCSWAVNMAGVGPARVCLQEWTYCSHANYSCCIRAPTPLHYASESIGPSGRTRPAGIGLTHRQSPGWLGTHFLSSGARQAADIVKEFMRPDDVTDADERTSPLPGSGCRFKPFGKSSMEYIIA